MSTPTLVTLDESAVSTLTEIERESNSPPWSASLFIDEFRSSYATVYGAKLHRQIVAFLVCHIIFEEAHVANFAVKASERGRGYGRFLITSVLDLLKHSSSVPPIETVTLEVRSSNLPAINLYESLGFRHVGVRPRYYTDPAEDALILTVPLRL